MTNDMIGKAKECKNAEELLALAKENNIEMTEEEAAEKFAMLHNEGELADDELEGAAGGGCHAKDGRLVITVRHTCGNWECKHNDGGRKLTYEEMRSKYTCGSSSCVHAGICQYCKYMSYEKGMWYCNHQANCK